VRKTALLVLSLLAAACGNKAKPRPVSEPLPEKVEQQPAPSGDAAVIDPYASSPASSAPSEARPDPAAAVRTGMQQYMRGDNAGALATLRASASANPGYAPTWRSLGLVHEKLGQKEMAKQAFKRYLQLAPDAEDGDQIRDRIERLGS
jgi:tetratricopeptide (TPR) repeat protein